MHTPVRNRSGTAAAKPSTNNARAKVHAAPAAALAATSRWGGTRSARFSTVAVNAPATNPNCTEAVSHTAAAALSPHSIRRAGTTADIENHTANPKTWTSAIAARWLTL